ncbi:MAG TPA: EAL domain-containing protein [Oleiagrimonas sp.]|nr:EAL domain-containing protein [Oleiagrimonas sp.]
MVAFILLLTWIAVQGQIALAGFLNGESVWSKAQKQVTIDLFSYAATGDPAAYADFQRNYTVLLAYRTARDKVQSGHYDYDDVVASLRRSHAMPIAIPNVIFAFDHFANAPYMKQALKLWRSTDAAVTELAHIADKLHHARTTGDLTAAEISRVHHRIDAINSFIEPRAKAFSLALAKGAVAFERLVFAGVLFFASVAVLLWLWMARRVVVSIRGSEERYRLLFDSAADAIVMVDEDNGVILDANSTVGAWTGRDARALVGCPYAELFAHDTAHAGNSIIAKLRDCDGRTRPVETQSSIAAWGEKMVRQTIIRDISERMESERKQRISAEALAGIAEGVIIADADQRVVSANAAAERLTGFPAPQLIGMRLDATRTHADGRSLSPQLWRDIQSARYWSDEVQSRRKDGSTYSERLSISVIRDAEQGIQHYVAVISDISTAKADRLRLEHLATHDVLTGLVNRSEFERYCDDAIKRAEAGRHAAVVLFIDLDAFKLVNDSYSHAAGDRLLSLVGKRLLAQLREADIAGRIGGDEFTVLLSALATREDAAVFAERMLSKLAEPFMVDGYEMAVSASIGIAAYPLDGNNAKTLIANADAAMYVAKSEERNTWRFYVPLMQADASQRLTLANELRRALLDGELRVVYQPCVHLRSGRIIAAEALLRWQHPERGELMPDQFIPVAERTGLIHRIDAWVLHTVCAQLNAWDEAGMPRIRITVNVSARAFGHAAFVDDVQSELQANSVDAQRIVLEITERAILRLGENTEQTMRALHALGIAVAIDDFGTDYASLAYLKLPAVTFVKIDRSFVAGLPDAANDAAIIKAILAMVKGLGLVAIAEGVEAEDQHEFLLRAGCEEAQGFLYSYPLPHKEFERVLRPRYSGATKLRLVSPFGDH